MMRDIEFFKRVERAVSEGKWDTIVVPAGEIHLIMLYHALRRRFGAETVSAYPSALQALTQQSDWEVAAAASQV